MKYIKKLLITEDGDSGGGGVASSASGSDGGAGSQSASSGVAYVNQGTLSGMGDVVNPQPSGKPGVPGTSGSGDRSFILPASVYTKAGTGITGDMKINQGNIIQKKKKKQEPKQLDKVTKVNDLPKQIQMDFKTFKEFST